MNLRSLIDNPEILSKEFDKKISKKDISLLIEWEERIRQKILGRNHEPCNIPIRWKLNDERAAWTHRFRHRA